LRAAEMEKLLLVLCLTIASSSAMPAERLQSTAQVRFKRDWFNLPFFGKGTTEAPPTTTMKPKLPNNLEIGLCEEDDKVRLVNDLQPEIIAKLLLGYLYRRHKD